MSETTSFSCPDCEKKDRKRSWTVKQKDGSFFCPNCGSRYSSYERAKILLDEIKEK